MVTVVQDESNCTNKYYTPPGSGCNGTLLTPLGTVPENESQAFSSDVEFELGGGFCSDNEIGASYIISDSSILVTLHQSEATEAGRLLISFSTLACKGCIEEALEDRFDLPWITMACYCAPRRPIANELKVICHKKRCDNILQAIHARLIVM